MNLSCFDFANFRTVHYLSTYLALKDYSTIFILEIVLHIDAKMLSFKARKSEGLLLWLVETQVKSSLGHINVTFVSCYHLLTLKNDVKLVCGRYICQSQGYLRVLQNLKKSPTVFWRLRSKHQVFFSNFVEFSEYIDFKLARNKVLFSMLFLPGVFVFEKIRFKKYMKEKRHCLALQLQIRHLVCPIFVTFD